MFDAIYGYQPVREVNTQVECHWSHAWQRFKRSKGMKPNGILECGFLPKNAHRTFVSSCNLRKFRCNTCTQCGGGREEEERERGGSVCGSERESERERARERERKREKERAPCCGCLIWGQSSRLREGRPNLHIVPMPVRERFDVAIVRTQPHRVQLFPHPETQRIERL
jgi:hypothetical protein